MNDDLRVRDIWKTLPRRDVVGHGLVGRVGGRAWAPPPWARMHGRFFARCGVPDPFDPASETGETGLGQVGLQVARREVAPHAQPPAPKKPAGPALPNVPSAPRPPPVPGAGDVPAREGRPAPRIGEVRRDDTSDLKRQLADKERLRADPARASQFKVDQPVARLPVRPDLAPGAPAGDGPAAPTRPNAPAAVRAPVPRPAASPQPAARGAAMTAGASPRPTVTPPLRAPRVDPSALEPEELPLAHPPRAPAQPAYPFVPEELPLPQAVSAGERAPDIAGHEVGDPFAGLGPRPPARPSLAQPPVPRAPPRAGGGGLDDLFGMGAGETTRVRIPKRDESPAEPRARRPMVVTDAEAAAGGIDRRPPPARPPVVAPSAPTRPMPAPDELPDA
jgi:hypothetical protein